MSVRNIIVSILFLIAGFGLVYQFIENPVGTLIFLGAIVISAVIIYFVVKLIFNSSIARTDEQKAYARAVKQSKKKHKQSKKVTPSTSLKVRKRDASHLKVIEGGKKKVN